MKKAMATSCCHLLSFFLFLLLWSFWFNSSKLTMKWWFFLMLKVVVARGKRLKKGDDLELKNKRLFLYNKQLGSKVLIRYN
jgi:hypothetical protein